MKIKTILNLNAKKLFRLTNNTLNSPIDFNDHNSSMETQAETDNSHKESEPIENEDESDPRSFEPESIDMLLMLAQSMTLKILKPRDSNQYRN